MTERKPPGVKWETFVERQIREGMKNGAFSDLPGHGKPLESLDLPPDPDWWLKEKLRREEIAAPPPALAMRRELDDVREQIRQSDSEDEVRQVVSDINVKICALNGKAHSGPPSTLMPLNLERVLTEWRTRRESGS